MQFMQFYRVVKALIEVHFLYAQYKMYFGQHFHTPIE